MIRCEKGVAGGVLRIGEGMVCQELFATEAMGMMGSMGGMGWDIIGVSGWRFWKGENIQHSTPNL
jgi:hypothetical protein